MPGIKTPQAVKDDFYVKYSNIKNYNELIIKNNNITKELNNIFKNNVWNLNENIKDLNNKNKIEQKPLIEGLLNGVYNLDFKKPVKSKNILKDDFFNMVYKDEQTTDRTEINYINTLKSWLKNIFNYNKKFVDDVNLNWIVNNQNEVLFKILEFRNKNKQSIETLRKDINTILKII